MSRLIVLDTETTGLSHANGDRIVELGCVELVRLRKGESRQWYIHPERSIPAEATRIHGITDAQVAHAPKFFEMVDEFLQFIGTDGLVIHNAAFDLGFLNAELKRLQRPELVSARVIDTLALARRKFPGAKSDLNTLCKRFKIDNTHRTLHGALLDANLLADVYVALKGGSQFALDFLGEPSEPVAVTTVAHKSSESAVSSPVHRSMRHWPLSAEEQAAHAAFLEFMQKEYGGALWSGISK
ncbi:MAG: DNA polymerase III subunit epsilon [Magnetococcales bacterium]|nr:DNA polymerase III subunit epsilon [Magnetococcales bacterium]NGZ07230.1 DNA polymerase III subunit epsilon [Magnetococcales bacterium]